MSYLAPTEFVAKMVDSGESKVFMSTRDTLIRSYMAGAILPGESQGSGAGPDTDSVPDGSRISPPQARSGRDIEVAVQQQVEGRLELVRVQLQPGLLFCRRLMPGLSRQPLKTCSLQTLGVLQKYSE